MSYFLHNNSYNFHLLTLFLSTVCFHNKRSRLSFTAISKPCSNLFLNLLYSLSFLTIIIPIFFYFFFYIISFSFFSLPSFLWFVMNFYILIFYISIKLLNKNSDNNLNLQEYIKQPFFKVWKIFKPSFLELQAWFSRKQIFDSVTVNSLVF